MKKRDRIFFVIVSVYAFIFTAALAYFAAHLINGLPSNNNNKLTQDTFIETPENYSPVSSEQDSAPIVPETKIVKISVVGDLMVHEPQYENAKKIGGETYDYNYSFSYISEYFNESQIVAGNLETVFGGEIIGFKDFPRFNVTDEFAFALKNAGFNLLTTANNHCLDQNEVGLLRTLSVLDSLEIKRLGTYTSEENRNLPLIWEENGIKFAFLSYTYGTNGIPLPSDKPWLVNLMIEAMIVSDIARAKEENPDFIIVMPHMGNEYETYTKQVFKNWINLMLKAGADIVLASHPHVLQPAEFVKITDPDGNERICFVAYSMGNFISSQRTRPREAGVIFNLYFSKAENAKAILEAVSFVPTWVKFYDEKNKLDIAVVPVCDALQACLDGQEEIYKLKPSDVNRLKSVLAETTTTISGQPVSIDNMQREFYIKTEVY